MTTLKLQGSASFPEASEKTYVTTVVAPTGKRSPTLADWDEMNWVPEMSVAEGGLHVIARLVAELTSMVRTMSSGQFWTVGGVVSTVEIRRWAKNFIDMKIMSFIIWAYTSTVWLAVSVRQFMLSFLLSLGWNRTVYHIILKFGILITCILFIITYNFPCTDMLLSKFVIRVQKWAR